MFCILLRPRVDGDTRKGTLRPFGLGLPPVLSIMGPAGCPLDPTQDRCFSQGILALSLLVHAQHWTSALLLQLVIGQKTGQTRSDKENFAKSCVQGNSLGTK